MYYCPIMSNSEEDPEGCIREDCQWWTERDGLVEPRKGAGGHGLSTLIGFRDSHGIIGRCDAKCYDAHGSKCECICGGANHGVGLARALDNTRERALEWLEKYRRTYPDIELKVPIGTQLEFDKA